MPVSTIRQLAVLCIALLAGCMSPTPVLVEASIQISDQGSCTLLAQSISCRDVGRRLLELHAITSCAILLNASVKAPITAIEDVLSSLQKEGFTNVTFAARSRSEHAGT